MAAAAALLGLPCRGTNLQSSWAEQPHNKCCVVLLSGGKADLNTAGSQLMVYVLVLVLGC